MNRRQFLKAAALPLLAPALQAAAGSPKRPNILLIMADDMGYSDPGCYGGEIDTPNLDALAAGGLRFTQFHNAARCCPTRASLMTGLYPHQVGLGRNGHSLTQDGVTLAEALKQAGYNTAMAGKWHLSETFLHPDTAQHQRWVDHQLDYGPFGPSESYPTRRGFDDFYGVIWGVINHFDPFSLVENGQPVKELPEDYYFTEAITDKAVGYIENFSQSDTPFFLYYAHCAPHWPLHARPEVIKKYEDRYLAGWETLRRDRYQRQCAAGLFEEANAPLPPLMDQGRKWAALSEAERRIEARKMAVHAAMVDTLDQQLGRVITTLKQTGQYENTLIIFLSDNGASPEIPQRPGYDRTAQTRQGETVQYQKAIDDPGIIGSEKSYTGIGAPWANAVNTPFKYWKKESYEGGMNTPCILHWPAGLTANAGGISRRPAHVIDLMPTCLDLAGAAYPDTYQGKQRLPLEGKSLVPLMRGQDPPNQETYCFEHERGRAIRQGGWKLVAHSKRPNDWELYHLENDLTETRNLAKAYPEKVKQLTEAWTRWADRVGAPR